MQIIFGNLRTDDDQLAVLLLVFILVLKKLQ